jgi:hypothetical protein
MVQAEVVAERGLKFAVVSRTKIVAAATNPRRRFEFEVVDEIGRR